MHKNNMRDALQAALTRKVIQKQNHLHWHSFLFKLALGDKGDKHLKKC